MGARLGTSFRAAGGASAESEDEVLEQHLRGLCERGRAAHADLDVDDESFAAHLGACGAAVQGDVAQVHAEDLYLACACLAGDTTAISRLRAACAPGITKALRRLVRSAAARDEVEQQLWNRLLVPGAEKPKLLAYAGRGQLVRWVQVAAQRIALLMMRHERAESRARNEIAVRNEMAAADPEMAAIKDRYRREFQEAVDAAIAGLDDRAKMLYRMQLVEGLTLERIAKAYGVSHPTIIRWLQAARERLIDDVKSRLREKLPMSSGEFDSLARLLISQLDLDISRALSNGR